MLVCVHMCMYVCFVLSAVMFFVNVVFFSVKAGGSNT